MALQVSLRKTHRFTIGLSRATQAKARLLKDLICAYETGDVDQVKRDLDKAIRIISYEAKIPKRDMYHLSELIHNITLVTGKMPEKDVKFLTTGDVAKKFAVSTQAVINWIEGGKIKAIRSPGGHYRIPENQFRTTSEQDTERTAIFEELWSKRKGLPEIAEDEYGEL